MRIHRALQLFPNIEVFDLNDFSKLSNISGSSAAVTLSRWVKEGKIISLRRGLYTLSNHLRQKPLSSARIANVLREPSYLSSVWALAHHKAIMESVFVFTSVTTWPKRNYENSFGRYGYQQIKEELFFGYAREHDGALVASPEKALLDYLYLNRRTCSWEEIQAELRLKPDVLNTKTLIKMAAAYHSIPIEKMAADISQHLLEESSNWSAL